jgi:hypothetical protein
MAARSGISYHARMRAHLRCIMAGLVFAGVLVLHGGLVDPGAGPVAHAQLYPRHRVFFDTQPKTSGEPMSCRTSGIALLIYVGSVVTILGMIKRAAQGGRESAAQGGRERAAQGGRDRGRGARRPRGRGGRRTRGSRSRGGWSRHRRGG